MKTHLLILIGILCCISLSGYANGNRQDTFQSDTSVVIRFRIFYPVGKTELYEDYMDNAAQFHHIRKYLEKSTQIDSIVIYSYASPEGSYAFNKFLAAERGKTAKRFLLEQLPPERHLSDSLFHIDPTAENWKGLREKVFYHYPLADKDDVLSIIDRKDITDERRKTLLKRLNRGESWLYILKHLMPELRYATWVAVWKRIPVDRMIETETSLQVDFPELPLPVLQRIPVSVPVSEEYDTRTILALKTNLLYDAVSWVNFAIEVPIKERFSVLYYHQFPWWTWGKGNNEFCMRFLSIGAEGRWWFKPMPREKTAKRIKRDKLMGHFIGVYAESGKWDFERKRDICYQGEHWSAGLSYGYAMPIGKRLNLELSASVGYASIPHRGFEPAADYSELYHLPEKDGRWHYIGPTKLQVSLVLPITVKVKKGGRK